jgi:steroid delta-isomerase-like uncharacterized protein
LKLQGFFQTQQDSSEKFKKRLVCGRIISLDTGRKGSTFMAKKYATIANEWFEEVWNQGKAAAIDRLLGEETIVHGIVDKNGLEVRGPNAFKEFHASFRNAFPDIKVEVVDTVVSGDKTAARCIVRGTHRGEGLGLKPTGKQVEITGMCIARVKKGKIVEAWNNFDFLALHQQLGSLGLIGG